LIGQIKNVKIDDNYDRTASSFSTSKKKLTDNGLYKKQQELTYKKIEQKLFNQFNVSKDPYWLNLILIENAKDYHINKYNTLCLHICKSFEKWSSLSSNCNNENVSKLASDYNMKIWAFVIATRHNLFLIDSISKSYKLNSNNDILMPYLEKRLLKVDFKDKAVMIAALDLQDKFDLEQVNIFAYF
jgi:hypothetical protein